MAIVRYLSKKKKNVSKIRYKNTKMEKKNGTYMLRVYYICFLQNRKQKYVNIYHIYF